LWWRSSRADSRRRGPTTEGGGAKRRRTRSWGSESTADRKVPIREPLKIGPFQKPSRLLMRLGSCRHSHFIKEKQQYSSMLICWNTFSIHPLFLSSSHFSVEYQFWSERSLFIPTQLPFKMIFYITVAFCTEEIAHLPPNWLSLRKSPLATTWFTTQKHTHMIAEVKHFPSSNHQKSYWFCDLVYSVNASENSLQLPKVETSFESSPSRIRKSLSFRVSKMYTNDCV
jgi:hypothetical protein